MGILVLAQHYEHATVFSVKENISIPKAQQKTATYTGTQLNFENSKNEAKSAKWEQNWLDLSYQKELKDSIQALKPGMKVTLYQEKTIDEDKYNAMDDAAKKKAGFWTVKKIYQGHVIPAEMADKKAAAPAPASSGKSTGGKSRGKFSNDLGMKVGHSIKGATTLCLRLKKPFMEGAKEVYDITAELTDYLKEKLGLDDYQAGNSAGNAVLNACFMAGPQPGRDVRTIARKIVDEYMPEIEKYIAEKEAPPPAPEAAPTAPYPPEAATPDTGDDDIPF